MNYDWSTPHLIAWKSFQSFTIRYAPYIGGLHNFLTRNEVKIPGLRRPARRSFCLWRKGRHFRFLYLWAILNRISWTPMLFLLIRDLSWHVLKISDHPSWHQTQWPCFEFRPDSLSDWIHMAARTRVLPLSSLPLRQSVRPAQEAFTPIAIRWRRPVYMQDQRWVKESLAGLSVSINKRSRFSICNFSMSILFRYQCRT